MKIIMTKDKEVTWRNRAMLYAVIPAWWWVELCSKILRTKYEISYNVGDYCTNNTDKERE